MRPWRLFYSKFKNIYINEHIFIYIYSIRFIIYVFFWFFVAEIICKFERETTTTTTKIIKII